MPTGMLLAPIGNPEPRSFAPLDTPYIFLENGTQTVKMQFDTFLQKIQNRIISCINGTEKNPVLMLRHQTRKMENEESALT